MPKGSVAPAGSDWLSKYYDQYTNYATKLGVTPLSKNDFKNTYVGTGGDVNY